MGLVSYTNLEDGNAAGANDINQRFGDVIAQVNGNLDASNIRNGSLTRELFTQDALVAAWPVGSVYITVDSTNPGSLIGGNWVKFGEGRTLIGVASGDSDFNESEKTGGTKTETITEAQMPSHNHVVDPPNTGTSSAGSHTHAVQTSWSASWTHRHQGIGEFSEASNPRSGVSTQYIGYAGEHSHSVNIPAFNSGSRGGGAAHNNLPPYITVNFWKRIS